MLPNSDKVKSINDAENQGGLIPEFYGHPDIFRKKEYCLLRNIVLM